MQVAEDLENAKLLLAKQAGMATFLKDLFETKEVIVKPQKKQKIKEENNIKTEDMIKDIPKKQGRRYGYGKHNEIKYRIADYLLFKILSVPIIKCSPIFFVERFATLTINSTILRYSLFIL